MKLLSTIKLLLGGFLIFSYRIFLCVSWADPSESDQCCQTELMHPTGGHKESLSSMIPVHFTCNWERVWVIAIHRQSVLEKFHRPRDIQPHLTYIERVTDVTMQVYSATFDLYRTRIRCHHNSDIFTPSPRGVKKTSWVTTHPPSPRLSVISFLF